jgi:hypothetical protein
MRARGLMRVLFTVYLVGVTLGIAYVVAIGLLQL